MRPLAVYTAIYGGYDTLKQQPDVSNVEYHCFTDDPTLTSDQWTVHHEAPRYDHPRMSAKYYKALPHEVLPDHRWTLWVDGGLTLRRMVAFKRLIKAALRDHDGLALYRHPDRQDITTEADVSARMLKYDGLPVHEQVAHYYAQGYADQCGLYTCPVMARDRDDVRVQELGEAWLRENERWTYQDQLASVLVWKLGIEPGEIPATTGRARSCLSPSTPRSCDPDGYGAGMRSVRSSSPLPFSDSSPRLPSHRLPTRGDQHLRPGRRRRQGPQVDVTSARMDNRQNFLSIDIDVEKVAKGDLIVFLKLRGHKLIRAVSQYRPGQGTLENVLLGGDKPESNSRCPGFVAAWSVSDNTIDLRIPSRCLDKGDYKDAKFRILTEIGPDADLAPGRRRRPRSRVDLEHLGRAGLTRTAQGSRSTRSATVTSEPV